MKLQSIYSLIFLAAACFVSCDSDDEPTDIRDQAVGTYTSTVTTLIYDNGETHTPYEKEAAGELTISKSGDKELISDDGMRFVNIVEASNGFAFNVPTYVFQGKTISGYPDFAIGSVKYHGSYISAEKKFSVSFKIPLEDFANDFAANLSDEDQLAILGILGVEDWEELDTLSENVYFIFKFECVKK